MASKPSTSFKDTAVAGGSGASLAPDGDQDPVRRAGEAPPVRLIFKRELLKRIPLSFPTIWKMMRENRFPRARIIGGKSAWFESEIDHFLASLPVRPYKDDAPQKQTSKGTHLLSVEQEGSETARSRVNTIRSAASCDRQIDS
jgi:predicted DNA-binding transcriptional regulator AlpA